ncbi:MAG: PKD domain-containing protein [Bacteroidetes bacterium]|nr:PKD domain-containing protein [Bacteroidota bacterium]MDA1120984.1 PKD domain-containing protein [Bacteroidota bacterium]
MKIVYVISRVNKAIAFEWLVNEIDQSRFHLFFVLIGDKSSDLALFLKQKDIPCYEISCNLKFDYLKTFLSLVKLLIKIRPAVVHTHLMEANILGLAVAWLIGIKVDFDFDDACLGEETIFENLTTGDGITSFSWDFGDGGFTSQTSPAYVYSAIGEYPVTLSATNNLGCVTTLSRLIGVHANPEADFMNDLACVGGEVTFIDMTTVESANITQWSWDFGNGDTSNISEPTTIFAESTAYEVGLVATSNYGCEDVIVKTVSPFPPPVPDFSFETKCFGEEMLFINETIVSDNNPVTDYYWEIESNVYTTANVSHTFSQPGSYTVGLTVTSTNNCTASISKTVEIFSLPVPEFTYSTACANGPVLFEDQSIAEGDPIVSRVWDFDGLGTANGAVAEFVFDEPGNYNISLTVTSQLGCSTFIGKTIEIHPQPVANFVASTLIGPPPLSVNFTNTSTGAEAYQWFLNDNATPFSTDDNTTWLFQHLGDVHVSLVATNEFGCTDTLTQVIEVLYPETDLALSEVIPVVNGDKINIVIKGANKGTLPINGFDIEIRLNNEVRIFEAYDKQLLKSALFTHTLNFSLPVLRNWVDLLCVKLTMTDKEEILTGNNENCVRFDGQVIIQQPYPNPTTGNLRLDIILPEVKDELNISIVNIYGKILMHKRFTDLLEGLNIFNFDIQSFNPGLYLVRIEYDGIDEVRRVRKE